MIVFNEEKNIFFSTLINDGVFLSGFGSKNLGDGRKVNTILNFLKKEKINYRHIIIGEQIHSSNVAIITEQNLNTEILKIEDTDGLVTQLRSVVLTIRTADCLPIIYVEKKKGIIGISHNGWRGTIKKISQKLIEKMQDLGAEKGKIIIAFGPSIGQCCYKIDEDRFWQFKTEFDGYSEKIFLWKNGWYLNLPLLNYLFLIDLGIRKENIDYFPFCTSCDKKRFFSFRRDKKQDYGEMLSFIMKNE
ncbi:MAG: peptidoglycan editing factor PgeF [Microgenomates group bacterium]